MYTVSISFYLFSLHDALPISIILLLYDTSLLVGLPSIEESRYLWGISPMALVVHLWGLRLLFKNAYSTQMEMVLFIGVLGLIGSMTSLDRKSTRLNSSHVAISYAVFCLKKKKKQTQSTCRQKIKSQY